MATKKSTKSAKKSKPTKKGSGSGAATAALTAIQNSGAQVIGVGPSGATLTVGANAGLTISGNAQPIAAPPPDGIPGQREFTCHKCNQVVPENSMKFAGIFWCTPCVDAEIQERLKDPMSLTEVVDPMSPFPVKVWTVRPDFLKRAAIQPSWTAETVPAMGPPTTPEAWIERNQTYLMSYKGKYVAIDINATPAVIDRDENYARLMMRVPVGVYIHHVK